MRKILLTSILLCSMHNASAGFIDNGSFLTDTASGLDWLDVTLTAGRSYNAVSLELVSGGSLAGWHYASAAQLKSLVEDAGLPISLVSATVPPSPHSYERVSGENGRSVWNELMSAFGITLSNSIYACHDRVIGLTADQITPTQHQKSYFQACDHGLQGYHFTEIVYRDGWQWDVLADSNVGSFLIRQASTSTLPEPTSLAIFCIALVGLGVTRRSRCA